MASSAATTISDPFRCHVCAAFVGEVDRAMQVFSKRQWEYPKDDIYNRIFRRTATTYRWNEELQSMERLEGDQADTLYKKKSDSAMNSVLDWMSAREDVKMRVHAFARAALTSKVQPSPSYLIRRLCQEVLKLNECFKGMPEQDTDSALDKHIEDL